MSRTSSTVTRLLLAFIFLFTSIILPAQTISLFNGKSLDGWHVDVPDLDQNPDGPVPFIIRDGTDGPLLVSLGTPGGHLITDAIYSNYRLEVEYRFAGKPGNCGVLVHASTPRALYSMFPQSLEVQMQHQHAGDFWCIVEDITVPDMVKRRGPKEKWGIVEGKNRRIENLTDDSEKPVGEWNSMIIKCLADSIQVWVNGELVNSGFDCTATKGQIAIQAEGSEVEFRKLELTQLIPPEWEEEVHVDTGTGLLEGTLLNPSDSVTCGVALIIAGSGPTDRNGNNSMMQNNSLKYLAEDLARRGIASLRYDKRGIGGSAKAAKNEADLVFNDLVEDARSWIKFLYQDKRFDEIYVIGHSEGSLIGMIASEMEEVNKYISIAGAGQPIDQVLRKQLSVQTEKIYQESCAIMDSLLQGKRVDQVPVYLGSLFRPSIQPYLINWFGYHPAEIIRKLDKPILIVQGTHDIQVSEDEAHKLKVARPDAILVIIDSMNHVFKMAPKERIPNMSTYNQPKIGNHPDLARYIAAFLKGKTINQAGHVLWPLTGSEDTHDSYPYWSPDGQWLLYSSGTRMTCNTVKISPVTGEKSFLTPDFAQHARWSPDGTSIVYDGSFGEKLEIFDVGSGQSRVLSTGPVPIKKSGMPCWSPDSKMLAYTSNGILYIQSLEDSLPQKIFEKKGWIAIPFDWFSKNQMLADLRNEADSKEADIWLIDINGQTGKPLITLEGRQVKPDLSPDGKQILFTSDHEGNADLWLADLNGENLQRLTWYEGDLMNPGYDLEASWSPDGQQIAFSSTRQGYWAIWLMEPKRSW